VFISAVTGEGILDLKDLLWKELNDERNKVVPITHTARTIYAPKEEEEEIEETEEVETQFGKEAYKKEEFYDPEFED
jgi:GTPase